VRFRKLEYVVQKKHDTWINMGVLNQQQLEFTMSKWDFTRCSIIKLYKIGITGLAAIGLELTNPEQWGI